MKKTIISFVVLFVLVVATVSPALAQQPAQDNGNQPNGGGFWQRITQLFGGVFGQNNASSKAQPPMMRSDDATSSGKLEPEQTEEDRLSGLVQAGKITEAQKQAILKEIAKIKAEVEAWSKTNNLDAGYIYGGLRGPGMDSGIGKGPIEKSGGPESSTQPRQSGGMMQPGQRPQY